MKIQLRLLSFLALPLAGATLARADGVRVTRIVRDEARAHGLQFVSTAGALTADRVVDGVHPNRDGSLAIARRVIRGLEKPALPR